VIDVKLDATVNYIVSGLERSGTSMMMQILTAGGIPTAYDDSRSSDENNPRGYYELEGGKIINKLLDGSFPFERYRARFVKITAFGLMYLPLGNYKIIYMERNLDEVMDSMGKMLGKKDPDRESIKSSFQKLNEYVKKVFLQRNDVNVLFVNYNNVLRDPKRHIQDICRFLGVADMNQDRMLGVVDQRLYRQRKKF
jgi:hypothetical protein